MAQRAPVLRVAPTKDGVWQVNERGPSRMAIAYFPSKWAALRHAVRVARAKPHCRVAVLGDSGAVRLARDYDNPDTSEVETP